MHDDDSIDGFFRHLEAQHKDWLLSKTHIQWTVRGTHFFESMIISTAIKNVSPICDNLHHLGPFFDGTIPCEPESASITNLDLNNL